MLTPRAEFEGEMGVAHMGPTPGFPVVVRFEGQPRAAMSAVSVGGRDGAVLLDWWEGGDAVGGPRGRRPTS